MGGGEPDRICAILFLGGVQNDGDQHQCQVFGVHPEGQGADWVLAVDGSQWVWICLTCHLPPHPPSLALPKLKVN